MLVDDHASFREALAFVFGRQPDIEVVAEARRVSRRVDVAIVDLALPDGDGVGSVKQLRSTNPRTRVLVVTGGCPLPDRARAMESGAAGVLHKFEPVERVIDAVRQVHAGIPVHSAAEAAALDRVAREQAEEMREERRALDGLTPREREVLRALAAGLSNDEIGRRLHIGGETVRTHVANVLGKLGFDSRRRVPQLAYRHGLVKFD